MSSPIEREWNAIYLDGVSVRRHSARVALSALGVWIQPDELEPMLWGWKTLRQTQGEFAGEPVRLERPGVSLEALVVESPESASFSRALAESPDRRRAFRAPLSQKALWASTVTAGVLALLILAFLFLRGAPWFADAVASRLPLRWEEKLGESVAATFAPPQQVCDDPTLQAAVDEVVARLVSSVPPSHYTIGAVVRMLKREGSELPGRVSFLSDHPRIEDRIQALERALAEQEARASPAPLRLDAPWSEIAGRCRKQMPASER